jgi:hypothetical protein
MAHFSLLTSTEIILIICEKKSAYNTRLAPALQTSKHLQKFRQTIFFILQMATKHLSLNKHFGRKRFQNGRSKPRKRYR